MPLSFDTPIFYIADEHFQKHVHNKCCKTIYDYLEKHVKWKDHDEDYYESLNPDLYNIKVEQRKDLFCWEVTVSKKVVKLYVSDVVAPAWKDWGQERAQAILGTSLINYDTVEVFSWHNQNGYKPFPNSIILRHKSGNSEDDYQIILPDGKLSEQKKKYYLKGPQQITLAVHKQQQGLAVDFDKVTSWKPQTKIDPPQPTWKLDPVSRQFMIHIPVDAKLSLNYDTPYPAKGAIVIKVPEASILVDGQVDLNTLETILKVEAEKQTRNLLNSFAKDIAEKLMNNLAEEFGKTLFEHRYHVPEPTGLDIEVVEYPDVHPGKAYFFPPGSISDEAEAELKKYAKEISNCTCSHPELVDAMGHEPECPHHTYVDTEGDFDDYDPDEEPF